MSAHAPPSFAAKPSPLARAAQARTPSAETRNAHLFAYLNKLELLYFSLSRKRRRDRKRYRKRLEQIQRALKTTLSLDVSHLVEAPTCSRLPPLDANADDKNNDSLLNLLNLHHEDLESSALESEASAEEPRITSQVDLPSQVDP